MDRRTETRYGRTDHDELLRLPFTPFNLYLPFLLFTLYPFYPSPFTLYQDIKSNEAMIWLETLSNFQIPNASNYFDNYQNQDITEFPLNSYVLVHYSDTRPSKMSLDWKGPYRVVAKDEDDLNRHTFQNLITQKLEDFPAARVRSFVVNEREDPMVAANADNHLQIVENILSYNGRKEEPHDLTFEVKLLGTCNPNAEILLFVDLRRNETLHDYLIKMGDGWQALVQIEYSYEPTRDSITDYSETHPTTKLRQKLQRKDTLRRSTRVKKQTS